MASRKLAPIHPGEVLHADFLEPLGISQYRLAQDISVPARRIDEIVHGKRAVSADTALRLAGYFGTSERFWLTSKLDSISNSSATRSGLASRKKFESSTAPANASLLRTSTHPPLLL